MGKLGRQQKLSSKYSVKKKIKLEKSAKLVESVLNYNTVVYIIIVSMSIL